MPFPESHGGFGRLSRGHRPLEIPRSIPLLVGKIVPCASEAIWPVNAVLQHRIGFKVHFLLCGHVVSRVGDAVSRDPGEAFVHLASRHVALQVLGVVVARDAAVCDARVVTPAAAHQSGARSLAVAESLVRSVAALLRLRGALFALLNVDSARVV